MIRWRSDVIWARWRTDGTVVNDDEEKKSYLTISDDANDAVQVEDFDILIVSLV